jgi:hypothetical protein
MDAIFVFYTLFFGWGVIFVLLWIRPEYMFLLFYVVANHVIVFLLFDIWRLSWADIPAYALMSGIAAAIALALGAPVVALRKWLKARKPGDKKLNREMERIRTEIAARHGAQQ